MTPDRIAFKGEMQLLSWSNSATGGPKVVLALEDEDALEAFKRMTLRKGKRAGQRLMTVMVEIGDDEKPVVQEEPSGMKRSQIAYLLCNDGDFQRWANANQWDVPVTNADEARTYVCTRCGVDSRSELDRDVLAADKFDAMKTEFDEYMGSAFRVGVKP